MRKVAALILILLSIGCSKTDVSKIVVDPGFSSYVAAFTSGIISGNSNIKVVLIEPYNAAVPGEAITEDLFDFEPELEGQAFWLDNQTIEFRPDGKLPSGESFVVSFMLDKLIEVESAFEELRFGFIVIRQSLFVEYEGVNTLSASDFSKQELLGRVRTSDGAEPAAVQSCLKATQNGVELPMEWAHEEGTNQHQFTIKEVTRVSDADYVDLEWNGEAIDADVKDDLEIRVAPLDEFSMVQVITVQEPGLHFSIQFSDPVDPNQDLDGLIHLNSESPLRFKVSGNQINAYPIEQLGNEETIVIEQTIRNTKGAQLDDSYFRSVEFNLEKPALELLGNGVIMPSSGGASFPFRAINLKAVSLRVVRVYEQNVPQFLQVNQLNGSREMTRVGRLVADENIDLISQDAIDYGVWNNFSIDLNNIIRPEPGAIYRVTLSFQKHQSLFPCPDSEEEMQPIRIQETNYEDGGDHYYNDYYWEDYDYDYDYSERDNPCSHSYYRSSNNRISANLISSDIGIIAKESSGNTYDVVITDLGSADPMSSIEIEAFNYQNMKIGGGSTSGDGVVRIECTGKPYLLVAKSGNQRGYLRVDNGSALSMSLFEVGGSKVEAGVKGFLYGERGVWRPGDTIFLSFILEDKQEVIPDNHPVVLELYDPMGKLYDRKVKTKGVEGHYAFKLKTNSEDLTGVWRAKAIVGNSVFRKNLKIETIKPNRLKIDFDFGDHISGNEQVVADLNAAWLYGSPGGNLTARVEMQVENMKTEFEGYEDYQFDDRSRRFWASDPIVVEKTTNADGKAEMRFNWERPQQAPGMLKMKFSTKVFEQGGDFSQDFTSTKYSPYDSYVGIKLAAGTNWISALNTEEENAVAIAAVDDDGHGIDRTVNVELYKMSWNWWWEGDGEGERFRYIRRESSELMMSDVFKVEDGQSIYDLNFPKRGYGKYLLRIVDPVSGHSSAQVFYAEYPGWWNNSDEGTEAAAMLTLEASKKSYEVGETMEITVPSGGIGNIYVTVEKGDKVLDQFWVAAESDHTTFEIGTSEEMSPNVYVSAMLIQPHGQDENSLPLRMYGIIPVSVNDENTKLEPVISAPSEIQPEQTFEVEVSEKAGKPMAYTLAVVDEGLLGLTRYKTPNPWYTFYTKEALGVRTWDMYKYVMSAQTGEMASLLAVGGDEGLVYKEDDEANRFKPVVKFLGPFFLDANDDITHQIKIPNYIGAVRVMVVGAYEGAYGSAEKEVQVKQPLMVLSTLPRVLGPSERIRIPVNVIAMDDKIKSVNVKVTTNDLLIPLGSTQKTVKFSKQGDQTTFFEYEVARQLGVATFKVELQSGSETAFEEVEVLVRPPNPAITKSESKAVLAGESWNYNYESFGIKGTNEATLQVSRIPNLDLEKHLSYLIRYPHGCIEQTTSSVFPQLSLNSLIELTDEQEEEIEANVNAGLKRLRLFQTQDGGFSYWPDGGRNASTWGTNYAGHFMLEAQSMGYEIPVGILAQWKKFQKAEAANWARARDDRYGRRGGDLTQAYRLYTLALAGSADIGAMNRLRSDESISDAGAWRLAAAYAIVGREDVALELANRPIEVEDYRELSYTFGSQLRDMSMILETLTYLDDTEAGSELLEDIASNLNTGWHSTQSRAYAMIAISKFIGGGDASSEYEFDARYNGSEKGVNSDLAIHRFSIDQDNINQGIVSIKNRSEKMLFVTLVQTGMPVEMNDETINDDMVMSIVYRDLDNNPLDVSSLKQGQDFKAVVSVSHPGIKAAYKEVALNQIFPTGWQIVNTRVGAEDNELTGAQNFTYQDIRDDRVYTYFDLNRSKKKSFEVLLNATFSGRFYKPAVFCAPMYDERIKALQPGGWVEVVERNFDQASAN